MPTRLHAQDLQIRYAPDLPPALERLTLALEPGVFAGVLGPNGSGKSTLIRALSRTIKPSAGAVLLGDRDLFADISARDSAQTIGVVPQDTGVSLDFTVRDIVRMGRAPHLPPRPFAAETAADELAVADALRAARIEDLAERIVTTLSGGERQRVLLARALAQQTPVLLLDEPTASLDLRHQAEVLTLAREMAHTQNKSVLAVLHDVNQASDYCDFLVLLSHGSVAAAGAPAEVLTAENIRRVYGARVWVRPHPLSGRPQILPLSEALPPTMDTPRPSVHVICGGGVGAGLLLALSGLGGSVSAACLHSGDPDADMARALGIPFAEEAAFSLLSYAALEKSARLASAADLVVVAETPFGRANLANLEAALSQCRSGKPVICLHSSPDFGARDLAGGAAQKLWTTLLAAGAVVLTDHTALLDYLTRWNEENRHTNGSDC